MTFDCFAFYATHDEMLLSFRIYQILLFYENEKQILYLDLFV